MTSPPTANAASSASGPSQTSSARSEDVSQPIRECAQNSPAGFAHAKGDGGPGGGGGGFGPLCEQAWPSPCPASQDW